MQMVTSRLDSLRPARFSPCRRPRHRRLRVVVSRGAGRAASRLPVLGAEPPVARGAPGPIASPLALAIRLLGVAAAVAYAVSRGAPRAVAFITRRIDGMAHVRTEPTGELIPPRTM